MTLRIQPTVLDTPLQIKPAEPKPNRATAVKTILVVEDESMILCLIKEVLKREGYHILTALDGIQGSLIFARDFDKIDLLLTDVSLPGMRGTELANFARKSRPDLKILFASGSIQFAD